MTMTATKLFNLRWLHFKTTPLSYWILIEIDVFFISVNGSMFTLHPFLLSNHRLEVKELSSKWKLLHNESSKFCLSGILVLILTTNG